MTALDSVAKYVKENSPTKKINRFTKYVYDIILLIWNVKKTTSDKREKV